jgi:hypothetical protein
MEKIVYFVMTGVVEHPERFQEFFEEYIHSSIRLLPNTPRAAVLNASIKSLARLCYWADTERDIKSREELTSRPEFKEYLVNQELYGPATIILSRYLGCEGENMYIRIFHPQALN